MRETIMCPMPGLDRDMAHGWGMQFCRRISWTSTALGAPPVTGHRSITMITDQTRPAIIDAFDRAARNVGAGGHIIYNNGHGSGIRSPRTHIHFFFDIHDHGFDIDFNGVAHSAVIGGFARDFVNEPSFEEIGKKLRGKGLTVTLVVCNIGSDRDFMGWVKAAWGLHKLVAYDATTVIQEDRSVLNGFPGAYPRLRLHVGSNLYLPPPLSGATHPLPTQNSTTLPWSWLELPLMNRVEV